MKVLGQALAQVFSFQEHREVTMGGGVGGQVPSLRVHSRNLGGGYFPPSLLENEVSCQLV